MPWKDFGSAQFEAAVRRLRPRGKRQRELFDLLADACRRRKLHASHAAICQSFSRAIGRCRLRIPRSWEDADALREGLRGLLGATDERLAVLGLHMVADQLVHEERLPQRLRHRERGRCSSCGRVKRIENIHRMLCPTCVGAGTAQARFDRLCASFADLKGPAAEIFGALIEFERRRPPDICAFLRVWGLGSFLAQQPDVPALRTWPDVHALRAAIKADPMPGRRHKAKWALRKACDVLVERGVLKRLPSQRDGPLPERFRGVWARFHVQDLVRRDLLRVLIEYFKETRLTVTAAQTAQAFAYYLARYEVGPVRSWDDIDALMQNAPGPGEPWHRRIQTALRRLGDALQRKGRIAPRTSSDALPVILRKLAVQSRDVHGINTRFLASLHEHLRRPVTLRTYVGRLNGFWAWAALKGIRHPAQVSQETVRNYLRTMRREGYPVDSIDRIQSQLRAYFGWLCRKRLVLVQPVPPRDRIRSVVVRVCERRDFEKLVAAIGTGDLPPREALVLYLLVFHALRNREIVGSRALGFQSRGSDSSFAIELPTPLWSVGHQRVFRDSRLVHLPTGRNPWLREIVDAVVTERSAILKRPDNPYLLVSESWRQADRPMHKAMVSDLVARATRAACGFEMTPTLVRQSTGTYLADASDHTICGALGWSPERAVELAYATREIITRRAGSTC